MSGTFTRTGRRFGFRWRSALRWRRVRAARRRRWRQIFCRPITKTRFCAVFPKIVADPTNIRDAAIGDPTFDPSGPVHVYYICVRANPRDANHRYFGIKQYVGYFYDGHLSQFVDAPPNLCDKAAYKPFPELEKLCLGASCK